jgi:glutamyl-tRNA reductase
MIKEFLSLTAGLNKFDMEDLGNTYFKDVSRTITGFKNKVGCEECMILQKCNCVEIYALFNKDSTEDNINKVLKFWQKEAINFNKKLTNQIKIRFNEDAIKHLIKTAMGLKSIAIGDAQVYGQVKNAFRLSTKLNCSGIFLKTLISYIKKISKDVDEKTKFRRGFISVPRIVSKFIENKFKDKKILIVGLGKMGSLLTKILVKKGFKPTIINRSFQKTKFYSQKLNLLTEKFENLFNAMNQHDLIVFAVNFKHLINTNNFNGSNQMLIDLSSLKRQTKLGWKRSNKLILSLKKKWIQLEIL